MRPLPRLDAASVGECKEEVEQRRQRGQTWTSAVAASVAGTRHPPQRPVAAAAAPHGEAGGEALGGTTAVYTCEEAAKVLVKLQELAEPGRYHAVDTETRGWQPGMTPYGNGEIICFSVYCGDDVDFGNGPRLWVSTVNEDGEKNGVLECFRDYFTDPRVKKVFHNYSFDRAMLWNEGIRVRGFAGDTMHMARLEDTDRLTYSLQDLGEAWLGADWRKRSLAQLMKSVEASSCATLQFHPDPEVRASWIDYSTFDTQVTWKLHEYLVEQLRGTPWGKLSMLHFYTRYWVPFADVLVNMEERGIPVDVAHFKAQERQAKEDMEFERSAFEDWLRKTYAERYPDELEAGKLCVDAFATNSPKQWAHLLFGEGVARIGTTYVGGLGLPTSLVRKKTRGGGVSVSKDVLELLAGKDPAAGGRRGCGKALPYLGKEGCVALSHVLNIKKIDKALGTFLSPFVTQHISPDLRVHTSLNLRTSTGRLSSSTPNLQQLPALEKDPYEVRRGVACGPGRKFVVADYGQLELRVLAHLTGCAGMIEALRSGADLHSATACRVFPHVQQAVDAGEVLLEAPVEGAGVDRSGGDAVPLVKNRYGKERRAAKAVNFGIAYGLTHKGLARDLGCSEKEAQDMLSKWEVAYPEVKAWQERTIDNAERQLKPYVLTLQGRRRLLPGLMRKTMFAPEKQPSRDEFWQDIQARRKAINAPVQGGAADIVIEAMIKADSSRRLKDLGFEMVLQVHDELIFEGPEENAEEALGVVREIMENPFLDGHQLEVPLSVDAQVVSTWFDAKG